LPIYKAVSYIIALNSSNFIKKFIEEYNKYTFLRGIMSMYTKEHIPLKLAEKNIILQGEWLTDIHMDNFQRLLASCSDYRPVET